jgi:hypothetical protein
LNDESEAAVDNLGIIVFVVLVVLRILAIPVGFAIALVVRRMLPAVSLLRVTILASYAITITVLFALIGRLMPALAWYDAAAASIIIAAGIVFFAAYALKRLLYAQAPRLSQEQAFVIFGEDARDKPKNLRRR